MKKGEIFQRDAEEREFDPNNTSDETEEGFRPIANRVIHLLKKYFTKRPNGELGPNGETHEWKIGQIPYELFNQLIIGLYHSLQKQPSVVEINPPTYVIGDLNGSYDSVYSLLTAFGAIPPGNFTPNTYLLLGDYLPFGPHPLEVFALIASLKIIYQKNLVLLNPGHHYSVLSEGFDEACTLT
ncbi:Serine/threonine-protein phosphatase [Entamoeba marina]